MSEMLRRLIGNRSAKNEPQGKQGGHGDHWRCVYGDGAERGLVGAIEQLASTAKPEVAPGGVTVYHTKSSSLDMVVIARRRVMESAFPRVTGGPVWPVTLVEVTPWQNGVEGQLTGVCQGTVVSFFDTQFYRYGHTYAPGETYDFRMGALAYSIGPAQEWEAETGDGVKVSFKGAHAYMPASLSGEGADIDDYWFHSPLLGNIEQAVVNGIEMRGYPIALALPKDFEMALTVYAAQHSEAPETANNAVGDDLQGYLWLQGHLARS
jgi:hypothetical protein